MRVIQRPSRALPTRLSTTPRCGRPGSGGKARTTVGGRLATAPDIEHASNTGSFSRAAMSAAAPLARQCRARLRQAHRAFDETFRVTRGARPPAQSDQRGGIAPSSS